MSQAISLLSPWSALVAAAIVPPLVLLYFLKLKRREMPISTTLLWKRAVEDLQVNSPFQKLRNNLLLLLQLLLVLLAVTALMEPVWKRTESREKKMILLVDCSASMNAVEESGESRLELARQEAQRIVDGMGRDDQVMVIAFADRARPVASFTNDKSVLKRQIDTIEPTDSPTELRDALTLAESYSTPLGENLGTSVSPTEPAHLILLSDGDIRDAKDLTLRRGSMEIVAIGNTNDNVAIVNMDVRRNYEQPDRISVAARVVNLGSQPVSRDLSLYIDGELKQVKDTGRLSGAAETKKGGAGGATTSPVNSDEGENEIVVTFEQVHATAGQIEVRLSGRDALSVDDKAYATIDAPRAVNTLLVTHGNHFLKTAMAALMPRRDDRGREPDVLTPEQYEKAKEDDLVAEGRSRYDVVVFDACSTDRLPPGNYLFFGGVPKNVDVAITGITKNEVFVDWDETHPVLRHVPVNPIHVLQWNKLHMPDDSVSLIQAVDSPVLSYLLRDRRQYLVCAFSLFDEGRTYLNTNWVMNEGFPVFMYNALQFLAGNVSAGVNRSVPPGETVELPAKSGVKSIVVQRPDGSRDSVPVRDTGVAYYAGTTRVGFYRPEGTSATDATFAVNLYSDSESRIRPQPDFRLGADTVAAVSGQDRVNRPIWSWLILAALLVLFFEWMVYSRRVYI